MRIIPGLFTLLIYAVTLNAQHLTLQDCFIIAKERNIIVNQAKASLLARQYNLDAEKQRYLPKIDALASYTYLSRPLEINLQTVRNSIVEGSSMQAVNTASDVYHEITGNTLSQQARDRIYNSSEAVINGIYPEYNPALSRQSYFLAGLALRQPIFLGNKLTAARNFAESEVTSGVINTELVRKEVDYAIAVQYLRLLYLNTMLETQREITEAFTRNQAYSEELVRNEILAPYQKSWTKVLLAQARTNYNNLVMDRQNVQTELNKLLGTPLDSSLDIPGKLTYRENVLVLPDDNSWQDNPAYQLVQNKIATARTSEQIARSLSLPNIFAVGNLNLYQEQLPVTMAPWMVGVEMQWNLFNGTQTQKRKKAAQQLTEEIKLAAAETGKSLEMQLSVSRRKIAALRNEIHTTDSARTEIALTRKLVDERMQNQLSSPRDLNDVILMQGEIEKAYHTAVLSWYLALVTYWNLSGEPQRITTIIK